MKTQPIVIFVEDYKNMSKEEFAIYIKNVWEEGYEQGKQDSNPYGLNSPFVGPYTYNTTELQHTFNNVTKK